MKSFLNTLSKSFFVIVIVLSGILYRFFLHKVNTSVFSNNLLFALNEKGLAIRDIPEIQYFNQLTQLIKEKYVDPIVIDEKFSLGAIQGMISYLKDPQCQVMDNKEYSQYKKNIRGEFEGIGVELILQFNKEQKKIIEEKKVQDIYFLIPELIVHSVFPNSPAEKAGILPGDKIDRINNRWIVQANRIQKIRQLSQESLKDLYKKQMLIEERKKFNAEYKNAYMPLKAKKILIEGNNKKFNLQWQSKDGLIHKKEVDCQRTMVASLFEKDKIYKLRFFKGVEQMLSKVLATKKSITLDLKEGQIADFPSMLKCLELLVPKGKCGQIKAKEKNLLRSLVINSGKKGDYSVKILIDNESTNTAKIFATVLKYYSKATVEGSLDTSTLCWTELFELPNGAYIIPTGQYIPKVREKI